MEVLKNAITIISVTLILYGVLSMFLPYENMGKSFKYVVSLSLLTSVAISLKGVNVSNLFDFNVDDINMEISSEFGQTVLEKEVESTEIAVKGILKERFAAFNLEPDEIKVFADISADNCIIISEVIIYCDKGQVSNVRDATNDLGLPITIIENGG